MHALCGALHRIAWRTGLRVARHQLIHAHRGQRVCDSAAFLAAAGLLATRKVAFDLGLRLDQRAKFCGGQHQQQTGGGGARGGCGLAIAQQAAFAKAVAQPQSADGCAMGIGDFHAAIMDQVKPLQGRADLVYLVACRQALLLDLACQLRQIIRAQRIIGMHRA